MSDTKNKEIIVTTDVRLMDLLYLCSRSRPDEVEQYEALVGPWNVDVAANEFWMNRGPKWLMLGDKEPMFAGGWMPVIPGVYQSWMVGTVDGWETSWRSITKVVKRLMRVMLVNGQARRLQTSALEERKAARWWYEKGLGMKYEGTMYGFGLGGENMVNYGILKEDLNG